MYYVKHFTHVYLLDVFLHLIASRIRDWLNNKRGREIATTGQMSIASHTRNGISFFSLIIYS